MKKTEDLESNEIKQELDNLKAAVEKTRKKINYELDSIAQEIDRILPPTDQNRYIKFKNYVPKDWRHYLA